MSDVLAGLRGQVDPDLLIGYENSDDAAVYRLSNEIAMVNTIDIITPPVDDPYWFGQIAAANAISDIYSMGGRPLTALNIVLFPTRILDLGILREILRGGHDKVTEAGASVAGGHSIDDEEPKYGLCVNGVVHPDEIITNSGAQPGDVLVLTKPVGTGVLFNAVRSGRLPYREIEDTVLPVVAALNGTAMEVARQFELHCATDITGFGLVGHLLEIARGSNMTIQLDYAELPLYPAAADMYRQGETTGSNEANRLNAQGQLEFRRPLKVYEEEILFDPQTSGGLVLCVPAAVADDLVIKLRNEGVKDAVRIGEVIAASTGMIIA